MLKGVLFDFGDTLVAETDISTPMLEADLHMVDGAEEVLASLDRDYTLAVISNTIDADDSIVTRTLARIGLDVYFDTVITSVTAGYAKPDTRIYQQALKRIGLLADEVVMVGDRLDTDILGANRAGILSVFHRWRDRYDVDMVPSELRGVPTKTITHFLELPGAIRTMDIGDIR